MSEHQDISNGEIGQYRQYLLILAAKQMDARLRRKVDASDIVQQTLLNAHAARSEFRGQSEPERLGWLRTILRNTMAMAARQYARQCRDVGLEVSLDQELTASSARLERWLASNVSTPSLKARRNESLMQLASELCQLPDDQREAIELHHIEELPFAEVAERMGRSKPSVAGLIFRGITALRRKMKAMQSGIET